MTGDRQLTLRAAVTGMVLGGVLALSNLYVVLKTGWSLGVTITATIVAFGLFRALQLAGGTRRPFTALENAMVASIASSGAWMTGGGNMAALPALLLLTGARPSGWAMVAWFALIASLGVVVAMPLREQFITREKLPFPMSVATAEAIRAMHGTGDTRPAKRLLGASVAAALLTLWRDVKWSLALPGRLTFAPLSTWSFGLDASLVLLGGGSLMKPRTAWSMLLGALVTWGIVAPLAVARGVVGAEFKAMVQLTLWPAAALLASSALVGFALQAARALRHGGAGGALPSPRLGLVFLALAAPLVVLMRWLFDIPLWMGVASLPLAVLVGVIGARVTGETDVTPTKAMGPLTQLVFGVALPANVTANVMGANVTAGVGLHAADLLSDLKTGEVLGADVKKQTWAQFLGIVVGALAVVPAFLLLVPDASVLGSESFPAPAVMVWAGVSKVLATGLGGLPGGAREAMLVAAALGAALVLLEARLGPERSRWLPSASALGIAMVLPAATSLTMFTGAMLGVLARRRFSQDTLTPIASGLIAGESVTGVVLALSRVL
ncbi:MAG: OPT/YSL family transporter [Myxococcota bacterium]